MNSESLAQRFRPQIWILKQFLHHKRLLWPTTIGSLFEIVLFTLPPVAVAEVTRELLHAARLDVIVSYLGLFFLLGLCQVGTFFVASYFNEVLAHRITTDITARLFEALQTRSLGYLSGLSSGEIMARAVNDTRALNVGLSPAYRLMLQSVVQLFVIAGLLAYYAENLLLLFLLLSPFYYYSLQRYVRKIYPQQRILLEEFDQVTEVCREGFAGIRELKSYTAEKAFRLRFKTASQRHAAANIRLGKAAALYFPELIYVGVTGLCIFIGFEQARAGRLELADLTGAVGALFMFRYISRALAWAAVESSAAAAASRRLYQMIFEENDRPAMYGERTFDASKRDIEFQNVSFHYNSGDGNALRNLSFRIRPGETTALVGPPGGGKTTIAKLILRLYEPTRGEILLGGLPAGDYSNRSLRQQISSIEQDIFLFSDTIRNNILFAKPQATETEMIGAAKLARAHDFILELPQGYDTVIGERGLKLSGGQKQRLAIARAMLLDPALLLLDDASSALDAKTEMEIMIAIKNVLRTRTALITTHRPGVIREADQVLYLSGGEIVAAGTHNELLQTSEDYARLFAPLVSIGYERS